MTDCPTQNPGVHPDCCYPDPKDNPYMDFDDEGRCVCCHHRFEPGEMECPLCVSVKCSFYYQLQEANQ